MKRSTWFSCGQRFIAAASVLAALLSGMRPMPVAAVDATGGNVTNDSVAGYRIHIFTNSATASNLIVTTGGNVEVLVVAGGGGGGGNYMGGGGGAGGLFYRASLAITAGTHGVTVGVGGMGGTGLGMRGSNGTDSAFSTNTVKGGGGGGAWNNSSGLNGGSGGGASGYGAGYGSAITAGQGNNGGPGVSYSGGGGGGFVSAGVTATAPAGGAGGGSTNCSISGVGVYYAGGGGGGAYQATSAALGGTGSGGAGGFVNATGYATAGTNGTGGGGGGAHGYNYTTGPHTNGGTGGSGIVIVRYAYSSNLFVLALSPSPVGATNVTLNGILSGDGGDSNTSIAVCWSYSDSGTNNGTSVWTHVEDLGTNWSHGQSFSTNLEGLLPGSSYVYRCYATNTTGPAWSDTQTFTTRTAPVLDTGSGAVPLSYATATLNGNMTTGISATVTVYWGANTNAWSGTNNLGLLSQGAFRTRVYGLTPGTLYYYRCYGTHSYGEGWSDTRAFTTLVQTVVFTGGSYDGYDRKASSLAIGFPFVNNANGATNVTTTNAWLNGILQSTGSAPATVYVYWGPTDGVTNKGNWANTNHLGNGIDGQIFSTNVSVTPGFAYAYRFYVTNTAGEDAWAGTSASFLTPSRPALNTGSGALPLSYTTATLNGNLTAGLSATVTVHWGQNTNAWSGTNSLGLLSQGGFLTRISAMNPGTVYYYRCYGTNTYGEGWSDISAFTTLVQTVVFTGGSYDGYDRSSVQMRIGNRGTVISLY